MAKRPSPLATTSPAAQYEYLYELLVEVAQPVRVAHARSPAHHLHMRAQVKIHASPILRTGLRS